MKRTFVKIFITSRHAQYAGLPCTLVSPLPYTPILGSLNSAVNKDTMSKIRTNEDAVI